MFNSLENLLAAAACALFLCVPSLAVAQENTTMTKRTDCAENVLTRSRCMIEAALEDALATYTKTGGGGISGISLVATDTYAVAISQEEREDIITYEMTLEADGTVKIVSRTESTESFGR